MEITITARHCTITDAERARARARLERLLRYEPRAVGASVIFTEDHGNRHAEVRLAIPGNDAFAQGSGETFRAALGQARDRVARQLKRRSGVRRRRTPVPEVTTATKGID